MRSIKVANAPCSWGTIEGHEAARIPYHQMLDELVATGYEGTELGDLGFMPTDPAKLREELSKRKLTMLGAFEGVNLRDPEAPKEAEARVLTIARLLAAVADIGDTRRKPFLVLADHNGLDPTRQANAGRITPEMGLTDDEWQTFARGAEHLARLVRDETGLQTVFHPHCAGFVETPDEIERFLDLTDPDLLELVFDSGHYCYGAGQGDDGSIALDGLKRFWNCVAYVHFKDCEPDIARRARSEAWDYETAVGNGVFCELGEGCVDFPALLEFLQQNGYRDWITVEQDVLPGMGTPKESARRNRDYLRSIGL